MVPQSLDLEASIEWLEVLICCVNIVASTAQKGTSNFLIIGRPLTCLRSEAVQQGETKAYAITEFQYLTEHLWETD